MNAITALDTLRAIAERTAPRTVDREDVRVDLWPATAASARRESACYRVRARDLLFTIRLDEDGLPAGAWPGNADKWLTRIWEGLDEAVYNERTGTVPRRRR